MTYLATPQYKCSDQYMRNLYCLASELAFLVSLMIMHVKLSQSEHDQPLDE